MSEVAADIVSDWANGTPRTAPETRPKNVAVYWYIKVSITPFVLPHRLSILLAFFERLPERLQPIHEQALVQPVHGQFPSVSHQSRTQRTENQSFFTHAY
ncbi:MAG: hypothetical protein RL173_364 [Fibrobacterota bacterium]